MSTRVPNPVTPYPPVPGQPSGAGTFFPQHPYAPAEAAGPFGNHATLADDLVSYWALDEESGTRYDSFGSNDLTDNNTVGFATVTGPPNFPGGKAASFVSANSETLSLAAALAELGSPFTVRYWVNQTTYPGVVGFVNNGSQGATGGVNICGNVVGNGDIVVYTPTSDADVGTFGYTAMSVLTTGTWQEVVVTYDGSQSGNANRLKVYVDGAQESLTFGGTVPASINIGSVFVLGRQGVAANFLNGNMAHVAIWSRVLTAQERTDLYNAGAGLFYED